MGGFGSTRWQWHAKKRTVEECQVFSVSSLTQQGMLQPTAHKSGVSRWFRGEQETGSVGFEVKTGERVGSLKLRYKAGGHDLAYEVGLTSTEPHFGGLRWYFVCLCGERVGKLYRPPASLYFRCRQCHDLTYRSAQEADKRVNQLKRLPLAELSRRMTTGEVGYLLGYKAMLSRLDRFLSF